MESFTILGSVLGCSVCVAVGGLVFAAYKLGVFYQLFHKTETKSPRHGGESVAEVLRAHGVKFLFTLVGGHISPILVACEKVGIRVVDTRHEATAVFAADAVARLSGTVGVAAVTAGPGLTNTVTAVKNAQMAESPLLLLGGAAATLLQGRGALQDIDQMSLFKPLCKFCASIRTVREIVPTLRKALAIAQSGTPGPVFIEFPIDTLYPYHLVSQEFAVKNPPKGLMGKFVSWYLNNHLMNLFAGAWETREVSPLPVHVPQATDDQLQKCIELLSRAKKPVILLGSQATLPPTPVEDIRKALEDLGVPCFLGGMSRGMLGKDSPIHIRQNRRDALKEADLVLLAGYICVVHPRVLGVTGLCYFGGQKLKGFGSTGVDWTPVIAVVGNDACWSQISREQVPILGSNVACGLFFTDYHTVADGYGGKGYLVGRENGEQLSDIIRKVQKETREGRATLLNVLIGKTNFREGSISV
ncbi:2-hydroxyacyl-CoA lyase 2 [Nematolebias whitei]|uniref:2-hydroxyacyl-CoA lyase 2 n=1 Tax=Nematolebias whitei TaxID=451745 RepID=UPI0018981CCF|nr:2-hydroxyacyl-CoA lyase 2 [Nematolebias whitei]